MFNKLIKKAIQKSQASQKASTQAIGDIHIIPRRNFFFNKKEEQKPENSVQSTNSNIVDKGETGNGKWLDELNNISFVINEIRDQNATLPKLLPEQSPEDKGKLTVAIEMDEVLLSTFYPDEKEGYLLAPLRNYDFLVHFEKYDTYLSLYYREYMHEFLDYLKEHTEPVLFCTGEQDYVELIMKIIDPDKRVFKHRIYQEGCSIVDYKQEDYYDFVKDLTLLGRDLNRTVLIDSKYFSFWANPDNAIPITEFYADKIEKDDQLLRIMETLDELRLKNDVRPYLRDTYCISQALEESKMI